MHIKSLEQYLTSRKPLTHVRFYYSLIQQTFVKRPSVGGSALGSWRGVGEGYCAHQVLALSAFTAK